MTDITELALRLKLEAHRAVSNFNPQMNIKTRDLMALVEALESEKRICATWRKTAEANSEKLEKAQQQMTESENRVRKQNRHICELFDDNTALRQRIAELESRTVTDWIEHDGKWRPESLGLDELVYLKTRKQELKIPYPAGKVKGWMNTGGDMDVMAYKLASPQASTVTVKLPDYRNTYKSPFADEVEHQVRLALELFSSASGIKVEVE